MSLTEKGVEVTGLGNIIRKGSINGGEGGRGAEERPMINDGRGSAVYSASISLDLGLWVLLQAEQAKAEGLGKAQATPPPG